MLVANSTHWNAFCSAAISPSRSVNFFGAMFQCRDILPTDILSTDILSTEILSTDIFLTYIHISDRHIVGMSYSCKSGIVNARLFLMSRIIFGNLKMA
jgi:hypothetical protein